MKVLITGGSGACGSALMALPHDLVIYDRERPVQLPEGSTFVQGDIRDGERLRQAMEGCQALIHLAASDYYPDFSMGDGLGNWDGYLTSNIIAVKAVFDAAVAAGLERILFASSHRVMGNYETSHAPSIYQPGHGIMIDHQAPVRPDSMYAVTKTFGENLGRLLADEGKIKFYVLRICSVRAADADHPYAYAEYGVEQKRWTRGSPEYEHQANRLKGLWQSRRDFVHMVDLCLQCSHGDYDVFYGLSNNTRRWFDIEHARAVLGYQPRDNAEDHHPPEASSAERIPRVFDHHPDQK